MFEHWDLAVRALSAQAVRLLAVNEINRRSEEAVSRVVKRLQLTLATALSVSSSLFKRHGSLLVQVVVHVIILIRIIIC